MRFRILKFLMLLSVSAAVIACQDESTFYDSSTGDTADTTGIGYLQLTDFDVVIDVTAEELVNTETKATTDYKYWVTLESTNLIIPVYDEFSYEDFLSATSSAGYPLQAGDYNIYFETVESYSIDDSSEEIINVFDEGADLGSPMYKGSETFTIKGGSTTTIDEVVCTMANSSSSVSLSADLKALFKPDDECDEADDEVPLRVTVAMGNTTYVFSRDDFDKVVYFDIDDVEEGVMEIGLSGMYNLASAGEEANYAKIDSWGQTISDVGPGQYRKITINVLHANEGNVEFEVVIENWVYDDNIDVNIMTLYASTVLKEEIIIDPEQLPNVQISGADSDNAIFLSTSEGAVVETLVSYFTPRNGESLKSVVVSEPNTNSGEEIVLWPVTDGEYNDLFTVSEDASTKVVTVTATDQLMSDLLDLPDGINGIAYYPTVTAIDSRDYETVKAYQLTVGEATVPVVTWEDHDFGTRYTLSKNNLIDVVLDITSDTGITGFLIKIDSEVLTPEELEGINLAQEMDLINPGDYEDGLVALGFPVGNEVKGQTSVTFDITTFMGPLTVLGTGKSDFTLTITNSAGGVTSVTIMLEVVND